MSEAAAGNITLRNDVSPWRYGSNPSKNDNGGFRPRRVSQSSVPLRIISATEK